MNKKPELLRLYNNEKSKLPSHESSFSNHRECVCTCPVCGMTWKDRTSSLHKRKPASHNFFAQTKTGETTYCPYCKGEKLSWFYNLAVFYPEILPFFDYEKNERRPEEIFPEAHSKIQIKCRHAACDYGKGVRASKFIRALETYRCPKCEGGKTGTLQEWNCLEKTHPEVAAELYTPLNGGITGMEIRASFTGKLFFKCPYGHIYESYLRNRCYRGDGCPTCRSQKSTSFVEQAIYYYSKKCFPSAQNRYVEPHLKECVDVFIPDIDTVVEYSSLFHHRTRRADRAPADHKKLHALSRYYRVYSLQEYGEELDHALVHEIPVPPFAFNARLYQQYNRIILDFLYQLAPGREYYPRIDLQNHELEILQQYVENRCSGNLEERFPEIAIQWDNRKNGSLRPWMFRPGNGNYRFWWLCAYCGRSYRATIYNRVHAKKTDRCPYCSRASEEKYGGITLNETFPDIIPYWHWQLNSARPDEVNTNSTQTCVFRLKDGRIVPVRVCNITYALFHHPDMDIERYLENAFHKLHNK